MWKGKLQMVILKCQVFSALTQLIVYCWQVWVIDLDIAYSDQLAMTQMLLLTTEEECRIGRQDV